MSGNDMSNDPDFIWVEVIVRVGGHLHMNYQIPYLRADAGLISQDLQPLDDAARDLALVAYRLQQRKEKQP